MEGAVILCLTKQPDSMGKKVRSIQNLVPLDMGKTSVVLFLRWSGTY